jgi:hypothetical protein
MLVKNSFGSARAFVMVLITVANEPATLGAGSRGCKWD